MTNTFKSRPQGCVIFFFYKIYFIRFSTAKDAYYLNANVMRKDTLEYGPIEAAIDVYDDFVNYESGTY